MPCRQGTFYASFPPCIANVSICSLQKLIHVGSKTQIQSRRTISDFSKWTEKDSTPPNIDELSHIFRGVGVDLAASACTQAMQEACLTPAEITHVVAVTCTDQGNPGYDLLVCKKLQLKPGVQRVLLHGVGCAGGLSALRSAANIIAAESQRGRPARVLVMACELCSLFLKAELQAASRDEALHIAPALFSDAAAAVVLCNGLALTAQQTPVYELQEWGSMMVPDTMNQMSYEVQSNGKPQNISNTVRAEADSPPQA
jgi:type III polyketide synthase